MYLTTLTFGGRSIASEDTSVLQSEHAKNKKKQNIILRQFGIVATVNLVYTCTYIHAYHSAFSATTQTYAHDILP